MKRLFTMDRIKRRKEEEIERQRLAEVYDEFRDTFEANKPIASTVSFIRGEVVGKASAPIPPAAAIFQDALAKANAKAALLVKPQQNKLQNPTIKVIATNTIIETRPPLPSSSSSSSAPTNRPPRPGKPQTKSKMSNLEAFKEELKSMQEKRQERKDERERELQRAGVSGEELNKLRSTIVNPYLDENYSEFSENIDTTNLYVSFLPLTTTNEDIYDTFGTFGPLASVRIMYPKPGDHRNHTFAFIAYMCRIDAERAQIAMNGAELNGSDIRVNWGKVVDIPETPIYVPPALRELMVPDPPTALPFNARPRTGDLRAFLQKFGNLPDFTKPFPSSDPQMIAEYDKMLRNAIVRVVIPTERPLLKLIHRTIEYLVREGPQFEAAIMAREIKNPMFRFLFDNCQPTHIYYRWRLFSILQGDDLYKWRTERFRMFDEGSWWEPPPHKLYGAMPPELYHTAIEPTKVGRHQFRKRHIEEVERERERENERAKRRRGALSDEDREFFEELLRNLTPKRRHVGLAMCWCLRRARSAKEIVECIVESLMVPETPLYKKLGRFYLLSDILANCGEVAGPDIAHFRQYVEPKLEGVFAEFSNVFKRIPTRINQTQFRSRVTSCIQLWSDNTIYPKTSLMHYQNVFHGLSAEFGNGKRSDQQRSRERSESEDESGSASRSGPDSPLNGGSDGLRGRLDSRAGQPEVNPAFKDQNTWVSVDPRQESQPTMPRNRWEAEDHDYNRPRQPEPSNRYQQQSRPSGFAARQAPPPAKKPAFGGINFRVDGQLNVAKASGKSSDEKRKILRELEAKVLIYQDQLEDAGDPFYEEKVEQYREELLQKADLASFAESAEAKAPFPTADKPSSSSYSRQSSDDRPRNDRDRDSRRRERSRSRSRERHDRDRYSSSYRSSGSSNSYRRY
uniref:U2 snRNP-associated SURP motif-containing protein n=1 Tax=Panagrellus redivivus TaxID=6233 RepID=A0A7E4V8Y0_PANRE